MKNYIKKPDILNWYIYKILLIMRLTTVILMVSMLQVSAASVAQEFNYVKKGASLIQVFKEIKKQTGYNIIWNEKKIDVTRTIDADFKKATIQHVLDKCLSNLSLSYSINDKMVMIKEKEPSFRDKVVSFFTAIDVRGRVVDENNLPLVGAVVKVKGSSISTPTNSNGEFLLKNVDENAVLVISFVGYEKQEVKATNNIGTVKLSPSTDKLEEVEINAGYYTVKERERTGSISRITKGTIEKQPINNPLLALQGRVSGVEIIQQTGMPGGGVTVQIRGQNSITSGNDPLYVVDGINYPSTRISGLSTGTLLGVTGASPLSLINPNEIESIEILKDADATAIYGSRGANGVILITTKKSIGGNIKLTAGILQGFSQVPHKVDMLNTEEFLQMREEGYKNDGLQPGATDFDVNGVWDRNKYTDWQKELIGHNANITNTSINITGGTARNNYIIGGNYYNEETVFPGNFGFSRASIRSSINLGSIEDRFNVNLTTNLSHIKSNLIVSDLTSSIQLAPNQPDSYDEYGKLTWSDNTVNTNPMANLLQTYDTKTDNLIVNLTMSYKIVKNLQIKTTLGYTTIKRDELNKRPLASINPASSTYTPSNRFSLFGNNYNNNLSVEPIIVYKSKVRLGTFDALLGLSLQSNNSQLNTIRAANFTSDDLMDNIGSAALLTNDGGSFFEYRYSAVFARLNYNLFDKYYLNLTARRDGSSRFGGDKKFANFGAIGAAWIFSDESLIRKHIPFLSFGKLRASYGITGNDQISDYGYLQVWNTNATYQDNPTITPGLNAPNPDFAWEINRKFEIATQLSFVKDKINIEFSFYKNRSSNLLLRQSLPLSTGLSSVQRNLPAKIQNIGFELDATIKILHLKNFDWSTGFNLTIPRNKLLSYPGLEETADAINYKIGKSLTILNVYNVTVDKETGLYSIEDKNANGSTDAGDRYLTRFLGQFYYGGVQNSFRYKQFNLDFHFVFTKQNGRSYTTSISQAPGRNLVRSGGNQFSEVLGRWQQPNDNTSIQRFSTTSASNSLFTNIKNFGNLSVVDASYIRLRNISLTYDLPKRLLSFINIHNASISLQGQNIFTLTNYIGLDPENQGLRLPPLRTLSMGLNLTF